MNHFNDPGKYRLEVVGRPKLINAWAIKYGQHYRPKISPMEDFVYVIEVEVKGKADLDEIDNSLFSMLLEAKHVEKLETY